MIYHPYIVYYMIFLYCCWCVTTKYYYGLFKEKKNQFQNLLNCLIKIKSIKSNLKL